MIKGAAATDDHDRAGKGKSGMQIDRTNRETFEAEIYIHDSVLDDLRFDRREKHLHLQITDTYPCPKRRSIDFFEVIGFEMSACNYWGPSERILDFEYIDEEKTLIPRLVEKRKNDRWPDFDAADPSKYIELLITFVSGDTLRVACARMTIS